jgi:hypothetical protein
MFAVLQFVRQGQVRSPLEMVSLITKHVGKEYELNNFKGGSPECLYYRIVALDPFWAHEENPETVNCVVFMQELFSFLGDSLCTHVFVDIDYRGHEVDASGHREWLRYVQKQTKAFIASAREQGLEVPIITFVHTHKGGLQQHPY